MSRLGLILAMMVATDLTVATQQVAPAFEVATIRPQTDPRPPRGVSSPDRFVNPGIFDVVREQLGLNLTPTRAIVSVLVIDSATLPTAD